MPIPAAVIQEAVKAAKKKRLTPLQADEAVDEGTATGFGGSRRRRKIDDVVDSAQTGRMRRGQTTDSANRY